MNNRLKRAVGILLALCLLAAAITVPALADDVEDEVSVTASSAVVMDYDTGEVLYDKDMDTMRVPASMTKIMTAYLIYEEMALGNLTEETMVTVSAAAADMSLDGDNYPASVPLTEGEAYSVDTLLQLILIPSASAPCYVMAEHISGSEEAFVRRMNETAEALGMEAEYENCHGAQPHYQTARSVALLIRAFIQTYPDVLHYTSMSSVTFGGRTYANTNKLLTDYYYPGVDGFKSGSIPASGYCLAATAERDGRRLITVVMNSATTADRHLDSETLLDYGFAEMARRDAAREAIEISVSSRPAEVQRGGDYTVEFRLSNVTEDYPLTGGGWRIDGQETEAFAAFTPREDQTFALAFTVTDEMTESIDIVFYVNLPGNGTGSAQVTLPVAALETAEYRDLDGHWSEALVRQASSLNLLQGDDLGHFTPDGAMDRGMFVTVLGRMAERLGISTYSAGTTPFDDVPEDQWYSGYLAWAWEGELVRGESETRFARERAVTREEAATLLHRFMGLYGIEPAGEGTADFTDADAVSDWAAEAVEMAVGTGLMEGYPEGDFRPGQDCTRAEVAVIFVRLAEALEGD